MSSFYGSSNGANRGNTGGSNNSAPRFTPYGSSNYGSSAHVGQSGSQYPFQGGNQPQPVSFYSGSTSLYGPPSQSNHTSAPPTSFYGTSSVRRPMNNNRQRPPPSFNPGDGSDDDTMPHWCHVCDKGFRTAAKLESHESEDHVPCPEEGCTYAAPLHILEVHKLRHVAKKGAAVMDDPEEVSLWAATRKARYPRLNQSAAEREALMGASHSQKSMGAIERAVRDAMRTASGRNNMDHAHGASSVTAAAPSGSAVLATRREGRAAMPIGFDESLLRTVRIGGKSLCRFFFLSGRCKYGRQCKNLHAKLGDDILEGTPLDLIRARRPTLSMQLLAGDVQRWEGKLFAALRYLVDSNFLQRTDEETVEYAQGLEAAKRAAVREAIERGALREVGLVGDEDDEEGGDIIEAPEVEDDDEEDGDQAKKPRFE